MTPIVHDADCPGDLKPLAEIYGRRVYSRPSDGMTLPADGESVLDVGAHIGIFAKWCIEHGAGNVVCVEPDPENLAKLCQNTRCARNVSVVRAAAGGIARNRSDSRFTRAANGDSWRSGLTRYAGRKLRKTGTALRVPTVCMAELLDTHTPHTVKLDIEGAEMEILEHTIWPPHVKFLVFEYSCATRCCKRKCTGDPLTCTAQCAKRRFPDIRANLERQGFNVFLSASKEAVLVGKRPVWYDVVVHCARQDLPPSENQ